MTGMRSFLELIHESVDEEVLTKELRGARFKIKSVTPTSFGTQIEFAKKYDDLEIDKVLDGYTYKIKGNSVFIIS